MSNADEKRKEWDSAFKDTCWESKKAAFQLGEGQGSCMSSKLTEAEGERLNVLLAFMRKPGSQLPHVLDEAETIEIGRLHDQATKGYFSRERRRLELAEKWLGAAYDGQRSQEPHESGDRQESRFHRSLISQVGDAVAPFRAIWMEDNSTCRLSNGLMFTEISAEDARKLGRDLWNRFGDGPQVG